MNENDYLKVFAKARGLARTFHKADPIFSDSFEEAFGFGDYSYKVKITRREKKIKLENKINEYGEEGERILDMLTASLVLLFYSPVLMIGFISKKFANHAKVAVEDKE